MVQVEAMLDVETCVADCFVIMSTRLHHVLLWERNFFIPTSDSRIKLTLIRLPHISLCSLQWPTQTIPAILGKRLSVSVYKHAKHVSSPWVILNDFGGAFAMGAVGGGIWYSIKGARNSPRVRACYIQKNSFLLLRSG